MKILFPVHCVCGHFFETTKTKGIQCAECGTRFDIEPNVKCDNCGVPWSIENE